LRGTIDAGDYKQFIFPLLFFKRLSDVYDEEAAKALRDSGGDEAFASFPENHRFQIPAGAHWKDVRESSKDIGHHIQIAMRAIESANSDKLAGIFGDAQWTNKDRLSDAMLRDLVEHFSQLELTVSNLPEDELGNGYEYLIKKFADDSGHTAAEFYTNRTVVHLMTEMLEPQPRESIYDPTCGSGGMLLSAVAHLRRQGKEWRNLRLYGQERNLMTSSIARMNCFLHGIEDFNIERGDTLSDPKFVKGDRLQKFDVVFANPPYSIKQWDREAFVSDKWNRNRFGTPPQGRADYAFWQHIIESMDARTGRCAILFPHGVLFRREEAGMRRKLIEADLIESIVGLGPNLFYNSPMEACVVICRMTKPANRKNKILFINAVDEVTRQRTFSYLEDRHISRIVEAYRRFEDEEGFASVVSNEHVLRIGGVLSVALHIDTDRGDELPDNEHQVVLRQALGGWLASSDDAIKATEALTGTAQPARHRLRVLGASTRTPDRADWTTVRFGDVVKKVTETVSVSEASRIGRYIGLEHLVSGSLHISEWGSVSEGTTFTRRCRPGHVLFAKRRSYQRKVAVAEFDAVVSGDIYVLAPRDSRLDPSLLPFICLSDEFFEHAVGTSDGSLSPRTNWGSLADFEFKLPPIDRQRRIAEILWAVEIVQQRYRSLLEQIQTARRCFLATRMSEIKRGYPSRSVRELGDIQMGRQRAPKYTTGRCPQKYLRVINVLDGELDLQDVEEMDFEGADATRYRLIVGDVLLTEGDITSPFNVGRSAIFRGEIDPCFYQNTLIRFRPGSQISPEYALAAFQGELYAGTFAGVAGTTTVSHLGSKRFGVVEIPTPPAEVQGKLVDELSQFDWAISGVRAAISETSNLAAALGRDLLAGDSR
jgi:type I restriction enzyme M protein